MQALWDNYELQASIPAEHGYVAAVMAIKAIEAVDGDVDDVDGMIEALENLELTAPRGPITFEKHSPIQTIYHRVVEDVDGLLQNTVIGNYTDVGPYWEPPELE